MARVHAVILHHQGEAMLADCLRTLLASRAAPRGASPELELEVVVLANGCREPLPPIVEREPRIHVVRSAEGMGFAEGNNHAARWSAERLGRPDYYYFLNNDTESTPEALGRLVAALERRPAAAIAAPCLLIQAAPDHLNSLGINVTEDAWGWDEGIGRALADYGPLPGEREVLAVTGAALLMDAGVWERIGGWTEFYQYYFEDIDLCLKAQAVGRTVVHVPEAVVYHRISATMTVGSERKEFFFWRNRLLLATVHWPLGLLLALAKRAVVEEIWRQRKVADRSLQRRALYEALARLPALLRERRRWRGERAWRRRLHPPGSVPVITLPAGVGASAVGGGDGEAAAPASEEVATLPASGLAAATWAAAAELEPQPGRRRVLVVGSAPLPCETARMHYTPGYRTWQLAAPLARAGHAVCVVAERIPGGYGPGGYGLGDWGDEPPPVAVLAPEATGIERLVAYTLAPELFADSDAVAELAAAFAPAVVVASSLNPAARAVAAAGELPLWIDLPGDPMAEAQAKAAASGAPQAAAYRQRLLPLLDRGDAFSAVSSAQRLALVGQLGLSGRLGAEGAGEELVHVVELALPPPLPGAAAAPSADDAAEGEDYARDDFVVLWSGGYNTWCDVDTLFTALETAMRERPELRFVSTGGEIAGHDTGTYRRFAERVAASPLADRFRLLGRLPAAEAARHWARADLGVLCERPLYERELGSAGRLLPWIRDGLPFVCTRLSALGEELAARGLSTTYPPGDASALARALVAAAADRQGLRRAGEALRAWGAERFAAERVAAPLVAWARAPRRAADAGAARSEATLGSALDPFAEELRRTRAELERVEADYHATRGELGRIHHSRMWAVWMTFQRLRRLLVPWR